MTNKVRGSIIDLPQSSATIPVSTTFPAGTVVFNTGSASPIGWKYDGSNWKPFGASHIDFSVAYDPPSLATLGYTSSAHTVTGASVGDYAEASLSVDQAGVIISAYVSAANTVTLSLFNPTTGTVNIPAGTLRIRVTKQ
jgi:hypothetical protein